MPTTSVGMAPSEFFNRPLEQLYFTIRDGPKVSTAVPPARAARPTASRRNQCYSFSSGLYKREGRDALTSETMQTEVICDRTTAAPWLEPCRDDGKSAERTLLGKLPFMIGRDEACDLPIASNRVSREHAVIERNGNAYRVQDLGSTNGTFVNGRRVDEAPLGDGDILAVADLQFSFHSGLPDGELENVTQVIEARTTSAGGRLTGAELIRAVRRFQEMLASGCVSVAFQPIVDLSDGSTFGYEALDAAGDHDSRTPAERAVLSSDCRLAGRMRQVRRMVAVEEALKLPGEGALFLKVDASEIGDEDLGESLGRLRRLLPDGRRLVVEVSDDAISDTPYHRQFRVRLRELGFGVAHENFAADRVQLARQNAMPADFVKLAERLVRGIQHSRQRQEQVQSIVRAGEELGCRIIAVGIRSQSEADVLRQSGCRWGQGQLYGSPKPLHDLPAAR